MEIALVREHINKQMPETWEFLRQMVEINSWTLNPEGVDRLSKFTATAFAPLGFTAEFVPSSNPAYGKHLVMTRRGKSAQSVVMVSHLDTVFPPEEEERNHFRWSVEGDRIYGPGTQDIKGGTAMMLLLLTTIQKLAPEAFEKVTWKLLLNSSEEVYSPDFGELCCKQVNAQTLGALVFETEGRLGNEHLMVVARKGRATWRVTVNGRGAHAGGKHSQGANAVVQLAQLLPRIAALTDYKRDLTFNVGTVAGGTVLNRVPHEAVAEGEFRAFGTEVYEDAKAALLGLGGPGDVQSPVDGFACTIKAEILTESPPWPRNVDTDRIYKYWEEAGALAGYPINLQERGGLSDGNLIWQAVPTLDGLGSWGDNDHCSERSADGSKVPEYIEVSGFAPKAVVNFIAIMKLISA